MPIGADGFHVGSFQKHGPERAVLFCTIRNSGWCATLTRKSPQGEMRHGCDSEGHEIRLKLS